MNTSTDVEQFVRIFTKISHVIYGFNENTYYVICIGNYVLSTANGQKHNDKYI